MGLQFKELVVKKEISIKDLQDKILAVDAMNMLYQFLTTIRSADGSALLDSHGHVTSHLIGLFNRVTSLMEDGLKLAFVFDGKAPSIKKKTWEKRSQIKKEAAIRFEEAEEAGDLEAMRRFASRTAILDRQMLDDAKAVIRALGLPIIQAPSEGEAQAAYMVKKGDAYAVVSQDYDNLIFHAPLMVRNLSIAGKRKLAGKFAFVTVKPELISLNEVLKSLELTFDQLVVLAVLVGTDYNPGGVKGLGPKKGLKLVKEMGDDPANIFKEAQWSEYYPDVDWQEIVDTIKKMPVTDDYVLEWKKIDEEKLLDLLIRKHDFNEERVKSKLERLKQEEAKFSQKGLGAFFE